MRFVLIWILLLTAAFCLVQGLEKSITKDNLVRTDETTANCSNILITRSNDLLSTLKSVDAVKTLILTTETQRLLFDFRKGLGIQWMQAKGECAHKEPVPFLKVRESKMDLKVHIYAEMVEQDAFRGRSRYLCGVVSPRCTIVRVNSQVASLFFLRGVTFEESRFDDVWGSAFHHDWMYGVGSGMSSLMIDTDTDSIVTVFAELLCPGEETLSGYVIPIGESSVGDIRRVLSDTWENGGLGAIHGRRFMTASLDARSIYFSGQFE